MIIGIIIGAIIAGPAGYTLAKYLDYRLEGRLMTAHWADVMNTFNNSEDRGWSDRSRDCKNIRSKTYYPRNITPPAA